MMMNLRSKKLQKTETAVQNFSNLRKLVLWIKNATLIYTHELSCLTCVCDSIINTSLTKLYTLVCDCFPIWELNANSDFM